MHILAAIAEFERSLIRDRVKAGIQRARAQGKHLGRPKADLPLAKLESVRDLSLTAAAVALGVSRSTLKRWRRVQKSLRIPA